MSTAADRVRCIFAACFPLGAFGHFWWVWRHGLLYHGPAPPWAVVFWYALCAADFVIAWLLLTRPRLGLLAGLATMAYSLWINWAFFPTFQFGFNGVLVGLTAFGVALAATTPWLWRHSGWRR
jgi:hypothetical protein